MTHLRLSGLCAALLAVATAAAAQDAAAVVADATRAMGLSELKAITFSGNAAIGNFGQSRTISFGLSSTSIPNYTRTIDFARSASLATGTTNPPAARGGPPPQPGTYLQNITPTDPWAQQLQIWATPWGFLIGAASHRPAMQMRTVDDVRYRVVSWSPDQKAPSGAAYRLEGYISPENVLERVDTWVEHPILGDLLVQTFFSDYQDAAGLKVPAQIRQSQGGMETFVLNIRSVRINPDNLEELMTPPAAPARGGGPATPPAVASEKLADGVYRITGGYVSLAVEFKDYVVVLEAGQNEARGLAVLNETRRLFPQKKIKYVVNTHAHFDHAGGLPPFVAEGITIITDDNNKYFLLPALGSPRTLVGDALAKSKKKPAIDGVEKKLVLRDPTRTLELHHVERLEHSDGMLIAYLPKERILFTADFPLPVAGQPMNPSAATLVENLNRLGLDFDRYVTVHAPAPDRPLTRADVMAPASR
ncbi:MAG TPA: MBL fold metallo-hydrolase [Vicinamibacterales bacterium]|nr:MBL fold metallo-hydrolase [Vicinamibacterales bacterium]